MGASPCSSFSPFQLIVDDRDSRITYYGDWVSDRGEGGSHWGDSFSDTTHRTKLSSNPANLTFTFQGTAMSILGDIDAQTSSNSRELTRMCYLDGQQISSATSYGSNILCGFDGLARTTHEVTLTARAASSSGLVMHVDAIQYTPLDGQDIDNATILVDSCDSSINFGDDVNNWAAFDPPADSALIVSTPIGFKARFNGINTNKRGAQLSYNFEGTKLKWMATIPSTDEGGSSVPAFADFQLFRSDSQVWNLTQQLPVAQKNLTQYNYLVVETPVLPYGSHRLVATYNGDANMTPLSLSYFYVYGVESHSSTTSHSHIGAIVGGVVGGVVGLLLILVVGWVVYHRRQRKMEVRAWDVVWRNRNVQQGQEALEMGPPKTGKSG